MKEDILKFRKCVDILIKEKGYNKNKISIESKINWPTMKKLLEEDINVVHVKASNLGLVQDFLHKHCDDMNNAGIKSENIPGELIDKYSDKKNENKFKTWTEEQEEKQREQFPKDQADVIMSGERDLGPVKESEKASLAGAEFHERFSEHIKSGKHTTADYLFEEDSAKKGIDIHREYEFWIKLGDALKLIPDNIQIKITVSKKSV
jgi:hypothetical protein